MSNARINQTAYDRISLPAPTLNKIIESITRAVDTERIYVFGSYARGEQTAESDLDLYVITNEATNRFEQMSRIGYALIWMEIPKDVLASSKTQFDERKNDLSRIEAIINKEGILLYG